MNIYTTAFSATCPNNGKRIFYRLTIEATFVLMVEDIQAACGEACQVEKPYHENMADLLHERLGGTHTLVAHHHGVTIKTVRT